MRLLTPPALTTPDFRSVRYDLQNVIRGRYLAQSAFDSAAPDWDLYNSLPRVVKCKRTMVAHTVNMRLDPVRKVAHYSGLHTCGSVWTCPVCAASIQEVRRQEIARAIDWAYNNGFKVIMVTFTAPHYQGQGCADLLGKFSSALKYLRSGRPFQRIKERIGFQGLIRSLETLHGDNGWHNHTHELWIVKADCNTQALQAEVLQRWEKACDREGMIPRGKLRDFRAHALDIRDSVDSSREEIREQLSGYLAKNDHVKYLTWGADREMTGSLSKSSRKGSRHPFQLIAAASQKDFYAWKLFEEYAAAFKGRASVYWSSGLKDRVGINDETDESIADREAEDARFIDICSLDKHGWSEVRHQNARAHLLSLAESGGIQSVDSWLGRYGLHSVPAWIARFEFTEKDTRLVTLHDYV